jgi:hypothetical protein
MGSNSNARKNETLGMPYGTATGKLRKNVLFSLLQRHEENVCVRCNAVIADIDDLSIEHIKPWEGISADLFWDLDNVAFSHIKCNRPHRTDGLRKVGPEGTAWCIRHKDFQPVEEFHKNPSRWNGLSPYCKECKHLLDARPNHAKKV